MALADRDPTLRFGGPAWDVDFALEVMRRADQLDALPGLATSLAASLEPVRPAWLADRLTVLWTQFMATRPAADPDALTIWLAETMRLLGDLPGDIVATAIDRAVRSSRHGFLPSVGEIATIADPIAAERRTQADRAMRMTVHLRAKVNVA